MESINDQSASRSKRSVRTCDIILPTYRKEEALRETLYALHSQRIPISWNVRIIVCDDGASNRTYGIVGAFTWLDPWVKPVILPLQHLGRAGARNAGIIYSEADVLMLLADDIVLNPNALATHLEFHEGNPGIEDVGLGYVMWDPRIHPTPFMEWMVHGGQQNDYDAVLGLQTCNPESFFYGSHISVKRVFIQDTLFSEDFVQYGWEDLELGSRLKKKGLRLHVLHSAIGLHKHFYTAAQFLERQQVIGAQKYRVNTNSIRRLKHALYWYLGIRGVCVYVMKKVGNKVNIPRIFQIIIAGEFWYGVFHSTWVLKRKTL